MACCHEAAAMGSHLPQSSHGTLCMRVCLCAWKIGGRREGWFGVLKQPYLFCAHISFTNNLKTACKPPPTLWMSTLPFPKGEKKKNSQIVLYSHTAEPSYCTIQHNRNRCILWWVVEGNVRKKIKNHHIGFEFLYLSSTNTNPGLFYYLYFPISLTHSWPNIYNIIPEWIIPACTDISLFYSWGKWVVKWSVKKKKKIAKCYCWKHYYGKQCVCFMEKPICHVFLYGFLLQNRKKTRTFSLRS